MLNALATTIPWLIGGAADLAPSTKTRLTDKAAGEFERAIPRVDPPAGASRLALEAERTAARDLVRSAR